MGCPLFLFIGGSELNCESGGHSSGRIPSRGESVSRLAYFFFFFFHILFYYTCCLLFFYLPDTTHHQKQQEQEQEQANRKKKKESTLRPAFFIRLLLHTGRRLYPTLPYSTARYYCILLYTTLYIRKARSVLHCDACSQVPSLQTKKLPGFNLLRLLRKAAMGPGQTGRAMHWSVSKHRLYAHSSSYSPPCLLCV